ILNGAEPPLSWQQTFITLIPKLDRSPVAITNWRPIQLSNCDAKIFSCLIANRLAAVLPSIIHPDQAGFIRGRQSPDVAQTIQSVLSYSYSNPLGAALLFLDQEKAYDRVSHDYLAYTLRRFSFPPTLITALQRTYLPTITSIMDSG